MGQNISMKIAEDKIHEIDEIEKIYIDYNNFIKTLDIMDKMSFKSSKDYCGILEHVSYEQGTKYLKLIETEFMDIGIEHIRTFIDLNDKYGMPKTFKYSFMNTTISTSPTTIRYIYHSLIILNYYKNTSCENIVEVGCGYGGLCLAINFFSRILNVKILEYNLIDLSEPCKLIKGYLDLHKDTIHTDIKMHLSQTYGEQITTSNLFFISNYCYTEIGKEHNKMYSEKLLSKTRNGFITWQNGGNKGSYPIETCGDITRKNIKNVEEEKPQTDAGYGIYKNYFVYF